MPSHSKLSRPSPRRPAVRLALALAALLLGVLSIAPLARAQERPPEITILHTAIGAPTPGGLPLSIFFALRDQNGNVVPRSVLGLDGAQGELTVKPEGGQAFPPVPITVGTPQTPIKIALVIDRSGSMNQLVGSASGGEQRPLDAIVRDAAVESIKAAPEQAEFAVFSFAERIEQQSDGFLRRVDQSQLIEDAIRRFTTNPSGTGNTCISDAALKAIETLNAAGDDSGVERKAVILFTDGLDKEADKPGNANNCTNADFSSVIRSAQLSSGTIIPIYTIWPCTEPCDQDQRVGLENLARETRGASAIGSLQEVGTLFQRVMELLNSQWVVTSNVLANQGNNTATLEVRLDNGGSRLPAAAPFLSPVTISPRPTIAVALQRYNPDKDSFEVTLGITNPGGVGQIVASVYNSENGGTLIGQEQSFDAPGETISFTLPTDGMQAGETFYLRVSGTGQDGQPLADGEGQPLRVVYNFEYQPKLSYSIGAVTPEYRENDPRLAIAVAARGAGQRELSFSGEIINRANGNKEALELTTLRDGQLRFPLPAMLRAATQPSEYEIVLRLEDGENVLERRTDPAVTLAPPPPPEGPPWLLIGLAVIGVALVGAIGGYVYMRSRPQKREIPLPFNPQTRLGPSEATTARPAPGPTPGPTPAAAPPKAAPTPPKAPPPARPAPPAAPAPDAAPTEIRAARAPAAPTVAAGAGATMVHRPAEPTVLHQPTKPRARIKVLKTVDPAQVREVTLELPCLIGREDVAFVITGDSKISRQHAELRLDGARLLLADLNSTNGTSVRDKPLEKRGAAPIEGPTTVGIGPNTTLEIELLTA